MAVRPMLNVLDKDKQIIWENTEKIFCYVCLKDITEKIKQYGDRDSPVCQTHFLNNDHLHIQRDHKGNPVAFLSASQRERLAEDQKIKNKKDIIDCLKGEREALEDEIWREECELHEMEKAIKDE